MGFDRSTRARRVLLAVATLSFLVTPLFTISQEVSTINGTVLDPRGANLPNAVIEIKNEATAAITTVKADASGHFASPVLAPGKYDVQVTVTGFAPTTQKGVTVTATAPVQDLSIALSVANAADEVTVEAAASGSIAAALAPVGSLLEARSARSEISPEFIQQFTAPTADFGEISQIVPGVYSINSNGVGLGQSATFFRGFTDGDYDITWDGIPFEDTNTPTHHSWAFFPGEWIGSVDFDRSPGDAATIGPSPFGGSINLQSKDVPAQQAFRGSASYGSFNTALYDAQYDSGTIGANHKTSLIMDVHEMSSSGFETFNNQQQWGGDIKVQYKFSDRTVLTGFSGVIQLRANTPDNAAPTRNQVQQLGYNYLMENTDPTSPYYVQYNFYKVPTDFEYVGVKSQLRKGWLLDVKPYTYNYDNAEFFANPASGANPSATDSGAITPAICGTPGKTSTIAGGKLPCFVDKYNSYRKYGETSTISQVSRFGTFRTGMWYDWSLTNRHQSPSDFFTHTDSPLPNFNEKYYFNDFQPYAEYELHIVPRLTLTGGTKYSYYGMNFTQFADNGGKIGSKLANGQPFTSITNTAAYKSWLPSADANYRIKDNWSVYAQFSKGNIIPPTSVFDVSAATPVLTLPKPTGVSSYQAGTVLKLKRITFDGDAYYIKFQNTYSSAIQTINGVTDTYFFLGPDSTSKGFELETNLYFGHGLSLYANGTANRAVYVGTGVPANLFVQDAPDNTEGYGLTYQTKNLDFGLFEKRIGEQWNDNGASHSQYLSAPFNIDNLFVNYTVRNNSILDGTHISFKVNNLFDTRNIVQIISFGNSPVATMVNGAASPYLATTALSGGDLLTLTPGRSVSLTFTFGYTPKGE
jgi:iron complex outermembrane recepter protein